MSRGQYVPLAIRSRSVVVTWLWRATDGTRLRSLLPYDVAKSWARWLP